VATGNGDPEVPELPSVQGYSWTTLPPEDISSETWSFRLGVGRRANNPPPLKKLNVKKPDAMRAGWMQMAGHSKGGQRLKQAVMQHKMKLNIKNSEKVIQNVIYGYHVLDTTRRITISGTV
jgi:hypothetical protein